MKFLLSIILLVAALNGWTQGNPNDRILNPKNFSSDLYRETTPKHLKYKLNVWKYVYHVNLNNGSTLKANSDILLDTVSGKYFLYYSKKDSVHKIFSTDTKTIERPNPFDLEQVLVGIPADDKWKFLILEGKINAYCYFIQNSREINEIQFKNGKAEEFKPDELKNAIQSCRKAMKAFRKRDYYTAIAVYNRKNN
jgi:hypothetical protein